MALGGVDWDLVVRVVFALGIGGLIGLERERWHAEKRIPAGIRTLPLVAITGVLLVHFTQQADTPWILVAGTATMGALTWQMAATRAKMGYYGFTTTMAFFITYLAGVLAGHGRLVEAAVVGVLTAALLLERSRLHKFADVLEEQEIRSAIMFLVISVILLPIAPADPVDPWGAVSLQQVLYVVVLVSGLAFLGFIAMRVLGARRGLPASGVLAGFVNSTAASVSLAGLARDQSALEVAATRGIILALAASLMRNLAIAVVADPGLGLALRLLPFLAVGTAALAGWAWLYHGKAGDDAPKGDLKIRSPFAWRPAVRFAALFILFSLLAAGSQQVEGGDWVVYMTALGGVVSTGAVVASMATLVAGGTVDAADGTAVVLLSIVASMAVKPIVVRAVHPPMLRRVLPPVLLAIAVALIGAGYWMILA